jgi:hypothetical protein
MNIQYQSMTGFGATAWNHGGPPVVILSMGHHPPQNNSPSAVEEPRKSTSSPVRDGLVEAAG